MVNKNLLVFIDGCQTGEKNPPEAEYRWSWVYAHGKFEEDYGFDIVLFNQDEPTAEGYYIAYDINSKAVIIHLVFDERGTMKGRCCYIDDYESLQYVNNPEQW